MGDPVAIITMLATGAVVGWLVGLLSGLKRLFWLKFPVSSLSLPFCGVMAMMTLAAL